MEQTTVRVDLGPRGYDIVIGPSTGGLAELIRRVLPGTTQAFLVADAHVTRHAEIARFELEESAGLAVRSAVFSAGEGQKTLATAEELYDRLAEWPADRQTLVVAVGGGVVGDLAGFVAATYARGLPLLMMPTTLLAMVDSSVGGKVGVNLPRGKNLVGAFHQPAAVWICSTFLVTLPEREFRSGLAEVVKYGVSLDADFFTWLEANADAVLARDPEAVRHIVARSCRLKADVVEKDEREETGLRMVLNYGHTFAHAFETVGGYGHWLHGEAVAAGMVCAARLAERLGMIGPEVCERQRRLLERFGLPVSLPRWPADELIRVMRRDKKARGGQMRFVLPTRLGAATVVDQVDEALVAEVLREFTSPV